MRVNVAAMTLLLLQPLSGWAEQGSDDNHIPTGAPTSADDELDQQIVVITDPTFVPISQYFSSSLNDLPPSSAGKESSAGLESSAQP